MTKLQEIKVRNYATLVMGGMSIDDVPAELQEFVIIEVEKRTSELLNQ